MHHHRTLSELHLHCELHPPPRALLPASCSWALASLFLGVVLLYHPLFSLRLRCLALRSHGRQHPFAHVTDSWDYSSQSEKTFQQATVDFSILFTSARDYLVRHGHVTDSFHGYWVYRSSPPSCLVPLLGCSYNPLTRLAPYCPFAFSLRLLHGRAPRLRSVVLLHCLGGGCQRLGFMSNACNATRAFSWLQRPHWSSFIVGYFGFHSGYNNLFLFCCSWCLGQGFPCWFLQVG